MTQAERNKLAEEIIWVYNERSKQRGVQVYVTEEVKEVARKAADMCAEAGVSPQMYVAAIEAALPAHVKSSSRYVFPYQSLAMKTAVRWCREYATKHDIDYEKMYAVQTSYLVNVLARTSASVEQALLDSNIDFKPWFRVLITNEPMPAVLERYGHEAALALRDTKLKEYLQAKGLDLQRLCQYNYQ